MPDLALTYEFLSRTRGGLSARDVSCREGRRAALMVGLQSRRATEDGAFPKSLEEPPPVLVNNFA